MSMYLVKSLNQQMYASSIDPFAYLAQQLSEDLVASMPEVCFPPENRETDPPPMSQDPKALPADVVKGLLLPSRRPFFGMRYFDHNSRSFVVEYFYQCTKTNLSVPATTSSWRSVATATNNICQSAFMTSEHFKLIKDILEGQILELTGHRTISLHNDLRLVGMKFLHGLNSQIYAISLNPFFYLYQKLGRDLAASIPLIPPPPECRQNNMLPLSFLKADNGLPDAGKGLFLPSKRPFFIIRYFDPNEKTTVVECFHQQNLTQVVPWNSTTITKHKICNGLMNDRCFQIVKDILEGQSLELTGGRYLPLHKDKVLKA